MNVIETKMRTLIAISILACSFVASSAMAKHIADLPLFYDHFTVQVPSSADAVLNLESSSGPVQWQNPSCSNSTCYFTIHGDSWANPSNGTVEFMLGSSKGPHCDITISDGAYKQNAEITQSNCVNAQLTTLRHPATYQYQFKMQRYS